MSAPATIVPKAASSLKVSLILSRIPIVVPEGTKLERQYRQYQAELEKRLMWTFPAYYYFKKGTLSEHRFMSLQKKPILKNPNVWFPRGVPDVRHGRERSKKQEVILPKNEEESGDSKGMMRPIVKQPIITKADETGDTTSLERSLRNTLYLLVNYKDGGWMFPSFDVPGDRALHEEAESGLRGLAGENINTWTVSAKPVAALEEGDGSYNFFIKSHILAGKVNLDSKKNSNVLHYAWLTRDEIRDKVKKDYFQRLEYILND